MTSYSHITSPCIGICKFKQQQCLGCYRQKTDVDNWFLLPLSQRQHIIQLVMPKIMAHRPAYKDR